MSFSALRQDGAYPLVNSVRGDAITGDRYWSREWMDREMRLLWPRVWHAGAIASDFEATGDYVTCQFGRESILMVRQDDGSIRAFFNACRHRGNRLVLGEIGRSTQFSCSYHGWRYGLDGVLKDAQDPEDFAGGSPCGRVKLVEMQCEVWGGFVWYCMDLNAPPLRTFLHPFTELLDCYGMDKMVRVLNLSTIAPCNWKVIRDNFNESYHLPTLHPELATFIDDDYQNTIFEMHESGHNRMIMQGALPSLRATAPDSVAAPLDMLLQAWDLDPADYQGRAREARLALQQRKRKLWRERGFMHYEHMQDFQLTDFVHCTLFPNLTFTMAPDGFQVLRTEPHPTDPEQCIFQHMYFHPRIEGVREVETPAGMRPLEDAPHEFIPYGQGSLGLVADQDLSVAESQQQGLHSRGYDGGILAGQEARIVRFHDLLNDMLRE